ncbi:glycosyltransferase family 8 protein [Microbacterium maritypicum]|uniref:glycosyltransferase family 8 protein n=2 Tax=Microbacterium maritypicum TaxID=33918 RepID=UPI00381F19A6
MGRGVMGSAQLNIAICLDENYLDPARTLLESLRAHHGAHRLVIWMLHDGLSQGSIDAVAAQCAGWASVRSVPVDFDLAPYFGAGDDWLPYQNKSVLFRILLPEQLRAHGIRRILYLDCDIICVGSLEPLVSADLQGATVGAVSDAFTPRLSSGGGIPGHVVTRDAEYFNSGVLLIDVEAWHERKTEQRCLEYLRSVRGAQRFYDQDALNVACEGQWHRLSDRFNTMITDPFEEDLGSALRTARLLHFVGPHKPWHDDYFPGNRRTAYELYRHAWRTREVQG